MGEEQIFSGKNGMFFGTIRVVWNVKIKKIDKLGMLLYYLLYNIQKYTFWFKWQNKSI